MPAPTVRVPILRGAIAFALTTGHAAVVAADTAPTPCEQRALGALGTIGCELGAELGAVPPGALVVSGPPENAPDGTRGEGLSAALARLTALSLIQASAHPAAADPGAARRLARAHSLLVYLRPSLAQGQLAVSAEAYRITLGFWERIRTPGEVLLARAFAKRPIDAEIAHHLPAVPLLASQVHKLEGPSGDTRAIACGDLDEDGSLELATVDRHHIRIGRLRDGRFTTLGERLWSELSAVAPHPLSEPVAVAHLQRGRLHLGLSDRADGLVLDPALEPLDRIPGRLPWPGGGCATRRGLGYSPEPAACDAIQAPFDASSPGRADTIAGVRLVHPDGQEEAIWAFRDRLTATVTLTRARGGTVTTAAVGAQAALADLDHDGQVELITSTETLEPGRDAVIVSTWTDEGKLAERLRLAVDAGVRAIGVCPSEGFTMRPIVVGTLGGTWLIR